MYASHRVDSRRQEPGRRRQGHDCRVRLGTQRLANAMEPAGHDEGAEGARTLKGASAEEPACRIQFGASSDGCQLWAVQRLLSATKTAVVSACTVAVPVLELNVDCFVAESLELC